PIFDVHGVTRQIKSSFSRTPTMSSGAYIVIEHTEAMHVVDVNSGQKLSSSNQEDAVLSVNLEAAAEIARQLRLRDIGGIIIVDFIDMRNPDNKKKLVTAMRKLMKKDRAQHTILALSKFGLMQITRQRVRPEVKINTSEVCPACNGTGKINASILVTDQIERDLNFILQSHPKGKLTLKVHPYVEAFLKKGIPNQQWRWWWKNQKWVGIEPSSDFQLVEYHFYDENQDEIRLKRLQASHAPVESSGTEQEQRKGRTNGNRNQNKGGQRRNRANNSNNSNRNHNHQSHHNDNNNSRKGGNKHNGSNNNYRKPAKDNRKQPDSPPQ
ncbi:MAG: ribonuclease E/G, partial [Bacteroidota bacterium]